MIPTQDKHPSHIRSVGQINSLAYKFTKKQQIPNESTHQLIGSPTYKLKKSSTYNLIKPPTHQTHQLATLADSPLLPTR